MSWDVNGSIREMNPSIGHGLVLSPWGGGYEKQTNSGLCRMGLSPILISVTSHRCYPSQVLMPVKTPQWLPKVSHQLF